MQLTDFLINKKTSRATQQDHGGPIYGPIKSTKIGLEGPLMCEHALRLPHL